MSGSFSKFPPKYLVLAVGLMGVNGPVLAQPPQEITVVAPHEVLLKDFAGTTGTGAPIEIFSLTRKVSYADLNLTRRADVDVLENRVRAMAKESCKRLDEQYPEAMYPSSPSTRNCAKMAIDDGMVQVRAAVQAARY